MDSVEIDRVDSKYPHEIKCIKILRYHSNMEILREISFKYNNI